MNEEQIAFLKSYDFMRLGQAIVHGQWQSAAMTVRRMEAKAKELELGDFVRTLGNLRLIIMRKEEVQAKQILSTITARRVQLLNRYVYGKGSSQKGEGNE